MGIWFGSTPLGITPQALGLVEDPAVSARCPATSNINTRSVQGRKDIVGMVLAMDTKTSIERWSFESELPPDPGIETCRGAQFVIVLIWYSNICSPVNLGLHLLLFLHSRLSQQVSLKSSLKKRKASNLWPTRCRR